MATADRLTREAAADGADLIVLPEKFNVLGEHGDYVAGAESLDGPTVSWARDTARELSVDLVAGSIVEHREGHEKLGNTSVHVGPDGEVKGVYRKIHMFDVVVGGIEYRESASEEPGDEIVLSEAAGGIPLGLTVCYDLRFPELFRILARPLGDPGSRSRDREPGVRRGRGPDRDASAQQGKLRRLDDRRPVGRGAGTRSG